MGRKGRTRPAELVLRLVEIGAQTLAKQLNIPDGRARAAMREIAHQLCREYGGQSMYVAKDDEFRLNERDRVLWQAYTGSNVPELASQFNLSEVQVRNIIAHVRRQRDRDQQPRLPGLDDLIDGAKKGLHV